MLDHKSREALNAQFSAHGFTDYKWIKAEQIVVAQWVRMKCMFGCDNYGSASCSPNVPAVSECERFFKEYDDAVIFHFEKTAKQTNYPRDWANEINRSIADVEKAVFCAGYYKAFGLVMAKCRFCDPCMRVRSKCQYPLIGRPTPEGLAVDVFTTVRKVGYSIDVLDKSEGCMHRYAFLLVQ